MPNKMFWHEKKRIYFALYEKKALPLHRIKEDWQSDRMR